MKKLPRVLLLALLCLSCALPSRSQDIGRVSPANLPLPLPTVTPMPPSRLRADNPWNLSMTGPWRFRLTHGQIIARHFAPPPATIEGITASSEETGHPPQNAFDGSTDTRWCASSAAFPQWLQADLGAVRRVTGVTLVWEKAGEQYQCRVEGSAEGKAWTTLADHTAAPGIGDGPVTITPMDARFVRVTVTGSQGDWASLREFQIHYSQDGQDVVWKPQASTALPPNVNAFIQPGYDDHTWNMLTIPSNWEMAGYSIPTYNAVDDTVGLYRRWVFVPKRFAGHRIFWHFDGALDGTEVYVNGQRAGYHESGFTAFDVDLTGLVHPGQRNLFVLRVCKTTPSVDCETGDFQCMGGVYRDTSLIAVPQTHVQDVTVQTPLTHDYQDAILQVHAQVAGTPGATVRVAGTLYRSDGAATSVRLTGQATVGADGTALVTESAPVTAPKLWTAETPNLYYVTLALSQAGQPVERVEQRFGFREIQIKNNVVLWNGQPIKCEGVCRHDFWANKGFALTDAQWIKDLDLMKAANINAIRTSHYNHAARFLELCDEKGFYVLDEVPFCWIGNKVKDPAFAPSLLQRAQETVARDKNRPCVLAWSLGNENPWGPDEQQVMNLVKRLDPTRPAFVSEMNPAVITGQDWQDGHYPSPANVDSYLAHDTGKWPVEYSEQPHTFWGKPSIDYDPGVSDLWTETLQKTWDKIWPSPTILGSFIWEWQNQGIADKFPDHTTDFWYGPHHLRQENNKGIVTSYRVLKPEYWIVKMVYSPVVVGTRTVAPRGGTCAVPLSNRYTFTDLKTLRCRWAALRGKASVKSGVMRIACPPGQSVQAVFPAPAGMTALHLEFDRPNGTSVTVADLAVVGAPKPLPPAALADGGALTTQETPDTLTVSNGLEQVVFSKGTGQLAEWQVRGKERLSGSLGLNLGQEKVGHWNGYFADAQTPVTQGTTLTAQRLPDGRLQVDSRSTVLSGLGGTPLGTLSCTYDVQPNASLDVHWVLNWTAAPVKLWEAGLTVPLPAADAQMRWWRHSYFTAYPLGHLGEPTGTCQAGSTLFRSSKRGLHWMSLTNPAGAGLVLLNDGGPLIARGMPNPHGPGFTLFASEEVAAPTELSLSWVADHDIRATPAASLSGRFTLRAAGNG